ncbi:hypothetical protein [Chenggangzhangella methanolivorans]|uniref:Antifreeze protein n=1 Tax=Chenggangzhangella methanolivorans TaxID=1437009 RepID=A0A9E6RAA3_9HYPH|nr:hypothetical protein [Chenggangzhangella methanolivorans]QZN99532.1 hypothetical protein K6K41_22940 [Chenggangzhangella methanolivorans]
MYGTWWKNSMSVAMLAFEAQGVIAQRMMLVGLGGPKVQAEMNRMVSEKLLAAAHAGFQIATGASQEAVISGYRRKVRANARRLSKP